jgi:hypothetical protein
MKKPAHVPSKGPSAAVKLSSLLKGINKQNLHLEVSFGPNVGRENL